MRTRLVFAWTVTYIIYIYIYIYYIHVYIIYILYILHTYIYILYIPYMGKFLSGKELANLAIRQYFTCQLFLLLILLATEVTKMFHIVLSLPAILLAHTDTERFTRSFTKVTPINRIDFYTMNLGLTNHRRFIFTTRECANNYTHFVTRFRNGYV